MSTAEAGKLLTIVFQVLSILALLALSLFLVRYFLEKRVRASMVRHGDSLVGTRAMVITDLRPGRQGAIRPLGSSEEEAERAARKEDDPGDLETFPAVADQLISRGRVVRVTGGDEEGYWVRPL
ncbi:MAG: hypothetical protein GX849_02075 [Clostridiaceae bacterium]|nr:hypothetical protein [Clostridiaceae bacterium]